MSEKLKDVKLGNADFHRLIKKLDNNHIGTIISYLAANSPDKRVYLDFRGKGRITDIASMYGSVLVIRADEIASIGPHNSGTLFLLETSLRNAVLDISYNLGRIIFMLGKFRNEPQNELQNELQNASFVLGSSIGTLEVVGDMDSLTIMRASDATNLGKDMGKGASDDERNVIASIPITSPALMKFQQHFDEIFVKGNVNKLSADCGKIKIYGDVIFGTVSGNADLQIFGDACLIARNGNASALVMGKELMK